MTKSFNIIQLGDKILREEARSIDDFTCTKFQEFVADMQSVMLEANGLGIAAPQLGKSWRIIIVAPRPTIRYPNVPEMPVLTMVNPSYEIIDDSLNKDWEGCLSIPGIRALVPRYRAVKVNYRNQQGDAAEITLEDFPARIFQHEYDHLQGMVYLDRVVNNQDIISESEFYKLIAAAEPKV
jgi:peptide deformylase